MLPATKANALILIFQLIVKKMSHIKQSIYTSLYTLPDGYSWDILHFIIIKKIKGLINFEGMHPPSIMPVLDQRSPYAEKWVEAFLVKHSWRLCTIKCKIIRHHTQSMFCEWLSPPHSFRSISVNWLCYSHFVLTNAK